MTPLLALANDVWNWRARTQPVSGDDIPRLERPPGWRPDWSAPTVARHAMDLDGFEARWRDLTDEAPRWPVSEQVDHRLIGSILARVRWELDVVQSWRRNPRFYVYQTLGPVFEALLPPPPFDSQRVADLLARAESIPGTLQAARANLDGHALQPFARLAIAALADIGPRLASVVRELQPHLEPAAHAPLADALGTAGQELERFRGWLEQHLELMPTQTAIGRAAYLEFLERVALLPLSPEQILAGARQELERSLTFEALEQRRNRGRAQDNMPTSVDEQIEREASGEQMLRAFCERNDLLTFPSWLRRYRNLALPAYLEPLRLLGVTDDLTSPTRLDQDGVSYIPSPSADLPYFYLAMARDPRTLIAHEGMHYYQLARSWQQPNLIRRHYYDSAPNEGIGFYAEEMLLQAGLFDDQPRSRETIYNFMRLRAIRVDIDVRLALGALTLEAAADELARRVPMDAETAREEAAMFATEPGQAISYQVGKLQILGFLSDVRAAQGDAFELRHFHDALWLNGNVPIALQRWEMLRTRDEVDHLPI